MTLRFVADENFNQRILAGIWERLPNVDIVRVQDIGLQSADDRAILEWAANEGRILLTHDVRTVTNFAYDRVRAGQHMPGAIEDLLLIAESSFGGEWEGQVIYLPLKV